MPMLKPVEFNFLNRVLKPGVIAEAVRYELKKCRPCNVIEQIHAILRAHDELQPVTNEYHRSFSSQGKLPKDQSWSSEEGLSIIYAETRTYLESVAKNSVQATRYLNAWDNDVWPRLKPLLAANQNLAAWAKRFVTCSRFAAMFVLYVAEGKLAKAVVIAFGVFWDITGELDVILPTDGAFVAPLEESLQWVVLRSAYFQKHMVNSYVDTEDDVHRVLLPGGGCDGVLWTRQFYVGRNEEFTLCDLMDYRQELSELMAEDLSASTSRVRFVAQNALEFMTRKDQIGKYNFISWSGVLQYVWQYREQVFALSARDMTDDGVITVDHSIFCPSYAFCGGVLPWPAKTMYLPKTFNEAYQATNEVAKKAGLKIVDVYCPSDNDARTINTRPEDFCNAGAAFVLKRHDG